jgi:hypothetical protein
MSAPKDWTWTPLSKALAKIDDAEEREAQRRDLWAQIADGRLRYRYRYPSDPPGTYREDPLPDHFFKLGRHNPVFDAVTYGDTTIWLIEIRLPSLPAAGQADAPPPAEPKRGRPSLEDQIRDEGERLQEGGRFYDLASFARAVQRKFKGVKGAGYKTIRKHLAGLWVAP